MKKAYVFLANGFEEIEALATVDILRRAGIDTTTVTISGDTQVMGAHNVPVLADAVLGDVQVGDKDWLILPGGMPGATNLAACTTLCELLKRHNDQGGHIAAICASPAVVLAPLGILDGRMATCYPGFEDALAGGKHGSLPVEVDGNVVTGNGPGNTIKFALTIVAEALGEEVASGIAKGLLV